MREMSLTRRGGRVAGVVSLLAVLVGCAATPVGAPRTMQPDDFKMLAGNWYGSEYIQQASPQAIQGVIQETGAFTPCCVARPVPRDPAS